MIEMTGRELAKAIETNVAQTIKDQKMKLALAVVLIGSDAASEKYVEIKKKACERVGISFQLFRFAKNDKQVEVQKLIEKLNHDKNFSGIVVQLPLPDGFVPNELLETIKPAKDVDGLNSYNLGRLVKGLTGIFPATAEGIINLLRYYQIPITGKKVTIIGQSNLVGKPLALMLLNEEATVLLANKFTPSVKELTLESDIVISAVGIPKLVKASMIKSGATVVDVGTSFFEGKIVGDVDFEKVSKKVGFITPSPGGVGPMTVAMLLSNVLKVATESFEV
jgi:methylenetetrahydrofolate dehydrogenase (NADP+)/methenyltetrahydrofolate cyclohydrolase